MENLNELIEQFEKVRPQVEKDRSELYKKREEFVNYFTKDKLASMTLEEYCGGKDTDSRNFCYRLWEDLRDLSFDLRVDHTDNVLSGQAKNCRVCGVSWDDKKGYSYGKTWRDKEHPFTDLKSAIVELYEAGKNKNWEKLIKQKQKNEQNLDPWFKMKFLSTYFPADYLNFCNGTFIQEFYETLLGNNKKDVILAQRDLVDFKNNHPVMSIWSLDEYAYFLWNYVKSQIEKNKAETMESSLVTTYKKFLLKNHNMIFTGAPGTGKTYLAKQIAASIIGCDVKELKGNKQFGFVQFHPSYDYTDFVEGLRPSDKEGKEFEYRQGIFKDFCASALKVRKEYVEAHEDEDPDGKNAPKFIFVIDEINRGEISKIFGELFFSIDPGYRGDTGIVKTQYQNMVTDGPFMDGFYVPDNVYIIGTMNDIDRSVETLDFAFRRRFPSIEITCDGENGTLDSIVEHFVSLVEKEVENHPEARAEILKRIDVIDETKQQLIKLNSKISEDDNLNLGSEYCIGGAYLLKLKDVDYKYEDLWKYYIEPVIAEYFRGLPSQERIENIAKLRDAFIPKKNEDDK